MSRHTLQVVGGRSLALATLGLGVLAIFWPSPVAEVLHSRLAVLLMTVWCAGFALFLHPELCARLSLGIHEFRKATGEVMREIRGDDDDDGPRAT